MRKIYKIILIFVFIFIFLFIFKLIYDKYFYIKPDENIDESIKNELVTDTKESDQDAVTTYAEGMDVKDFVNLINKQSNYIESSETEYKNVYYDFYRHLEYSELEKIYNGLNISSAVKLENIGFSEDERVMYSVEIGFGKKIIMMEAGIHSAEIANPLFLTKYMVDLVNAYEDKESENHNEVVNMLNNYKIVILPCGNPDGYDLHLYGIEKIKNSFSFVRKTDTLNLFYYKGNINGVDLNRNFPSQTSGLYYIENGLSSTTVINPTGERLQYYAGSTLGSENETKNIMYWILKHYKESYVYISLHSMGRVVYNGKPNLSTQYNYLSNNYAEVIKKYTNYYNILGSDSDDIGYGNDGTSTDFYSELMNGFKFSNKTGRLSSTGYLNNNATLSYQGASITIETLTAFTNSLETIKAEWNDQKIYKVLNSIVNLR